MIDNWKKYKLRRGSIVFGLSIDILLLFFYIYTLFLLEQAPGKQLSVLFTVCSNILLVGISVLSASLLSIPFIEIREKNDLFQRHILIDALSSPNVFSKLDDGERKAMLSTLESCVYFDDCAVKQDMYNSIRHKINNFSGVETAKDCYFESCKYDINCTIKDGYVEKSIMKVVDLRSYFDKTISNYPLCSSSSVNAQDGQFSTIESLSINGTEQNIKKTVTAEGNAETGPFSKRSGYKQRVTYKYHGSLNTSPDKSVKIAVSHKTSVPDNDLAFSCRLACPCHHFEFRFKLSGDDAKKYRIIVNAFGFAEDGRKTPNRPDNSEIFVSFDNWIFPMDGVSVSLIQNKDSA